MDTTLVNIFTVIGIISLVFEIWVLYSFVNLCRNTKEINSNIKIIKNSVTQLVDRVFDLNNNSVYVTRKDVNLALLNGREDQCYRNIIDSLFATYCEICKSNQDGQMEYEGGFDSLIIKSVNQSKSYCNLLGKQLPSELISIENFIHFYNKNIATN